MNPSEEAVLLPCPFCGSEPFYVLGGFARCSNQGCAMKTFGTPLEAWNRRASSQAESGEALAKAEAFLRREVDYWRAEVAKFPEEDIRNIGYAVALQNQLASEYHLSAIGNPAYLDLVLSRLTPPPPSSAKLKRGEGVED